MCAWIMLLVWSTSAWATTSELRELYFGTRAKGLGGAYTAVADDEQTLFLNPAGLAGIRGQQLHYALMDGEVSTDTIGQASLVSTLSDINASTFNQFMGKNTYTRGQLSPTFLMPNFGVGVLMDGQAALLANNTALPDVVVGYQQTMGIQAGFGFSVSQTGGRRRRSRSAQVDSAGSPELRLGVGFKMLWRRGGYRSMPLSQLMSISTESLKAMAGSYGRGMGFDLGSQYLVPLNSRLTVSAGLAMTEIGDIAFNSEAESQKGNLSFGVAARYKLPRSEFLLAYDYRHITRDTDWRKRSHLGLEAKLPFISLYMGLSQLRLTYGVAFDAWMFKITAVSYSEEISAIWGTDPERRYALRIALGFGL